ncbi:MAG TPA: class I SAM-dependent methyltransferase [Jiangellaceae bacterium]
MSRSNLEHPCFARLYSRVGRWLVLHGGSRHRQRLLAPLTGRIIEVGAGNGLNFAYYPATVTRVLAVEPESRLRSEARRAAASAPVGVDVVGGRAEQLPVRSDVFDGAVLSLVLCSIADRQAALAELRRVIRPGGLVRFYEHVRSPSPVVGRIQDVITPVWSQFAGGCQLNRDAAAALRAAGLSITDVDQFTFAGVTHVLGTAHTDNPAATETTSMPPPV